MRSRELVDLSKEALRDGRHVTEPEIRSHRLRTHYTELGIRREQRAYLGGEDEAISQFRPEQWLLTERVSRTDEFLPLVVPERDGEHPVHAIEGGVFPLGPGV